jgi:hypothetical protein
MLTLRDAIPNAHALASHRTILGTHNASQKSDPQRAENDASVMRVLEKISPPTPARW